MSNGWTESVIEKSTKTIAEERYIRLNGKVIFKHHDGTRHFVYEAEMDKGLYRLRCLKNSHTFTHYDSVEDLTNAGWVLA